MRLNNYLPETPSLMGKMEDLNAKLGFLSLSKAEGDTGSSPTLGIDYLVNTYIKNQVQFRRQLMQDLQTIAFQVEELRGPVSHITGEVFRRGLTFEPTKADPDEEELNRIKKFLRDCNTFDQSLEEVLRQFHWDLNTLDDAFLYIHKEYYHDEGDVLRSRIQEIRRLNPALIEFDLNDEGMPKKQHFVCALHREETREEDGKCGTKDCGLALRPAMYKYHNRGEVHYFLDSEIIHLSKFNPTETYGWSPILTIFEKALTLIGMDRNLYRYFFERKMPASMLMVSTDDPESLKREREAIAVQARQDPNFVPMVAVSSKTNRGRVDLVRLFHTLQEMDYLPVKQEIRERIAALWGVSPAWQGTPDAFGGLSTQTQQLMVMSRVVEADQRLFHEKVFPLILEGFGVKDWKLVLPHPEEKAEATRINFASQRANIAKMLNDMGFDIQLRRQSAALEDVDFVISGAPVPLAQIQGETQVLALTAQEEQLRQQAIMQVQQEAAQAEQEQQAPQEVENSMEKGEGKYKDRNLGWRTPNADDKMPLDERDIDEYAEARERKGENRMFGLEKSGETFTSSWMDALVTQGYPTPLVKEISPDGTKMWFIQGDKQYVAFLTPTGVDRVEPATFTIPKPPANKRVEPSNQSTSNTGDVIRLDEEDDD